MAGSHVINNRDHVLSVKKGGLGLERAHSFGGGYLLMLERAIPDMFLVNTEIQLAFTLIRFSTSGSYVALL